MKTFQQLEALKGVVRAEILTKARELLPLFERLQLPVPTLTVGADQTLGIAWHNGRRHAALNLSAGDMLLCFSGDGEGMHMKNVSPVFMETEIGKIGGWLG